MIGIIETVNEDTWRDDLGRSKIKREGKPLWIFCSLVPPKRSQDSLIEALAFSAYLSGDSIVFSVIETGWDSMLEEAARVNIPVIAVDKSVQPGTGAECPLRRLRPSEYCQIHGTSTCKMYCASSDKEIVELCGTFGS